MKNPPSPRKEEGRKKIVMGTEKNEKEKGSAERKPELRLMFAFSQREEKKKKKETRRFENETKRKTHKNALLPLHLTHS